MTYPETIGYSDNNTSKESAKRKRKSGAAEKEMILNLFKSAERGYTAHEVYKLLPGITLNSTRSRMTELKEEGFLVKTDEKVYDEMGYPSAKFYYYRFYYRGIKWDDCGQSSLV